MTNDRKNRQSLLLPILIPVGSLVVIAGALYGFSRVLLQVSSTAATATALTAAVGIVAIAGLTAGRKQVGTGALFSMVGGVAGVAMLAGGAALLLGQPTEEGPGEPVPVVAITAPMGAAADGFASTTVSAPAGVPFEIAFDNEDTQQHNVAIATDDTLSSVLFSGTIVSGPVKTVYDVEEPLDAGTYVFFCAVHPTTMMGSLEVTEGGGGGAGEGVTVVAKAIAFDTDVLSLPADAPSTITFDNQDPFGHNIAIYEDAAFLKALWNGEVIEGPATTEYAVPPLEAGSYFFKCDIHANMTGTVEVGGPAPGEGPVPSDGEPPPSVTEPPPSDGG